MLDLTQPPTGVSSSAFPGTPPLGATRPPVPPPGTVPAPVPGVPHENLRLRIAHWMERTFGRAYVPLAMAAGGAVGATAGFLTLGIPGALVGGAAGAVLGGVLVFAG